MQVKKQKPATMSDVARLANVSMKTVSRVFNKEKYVSEEKREKVLAVAKSLNYQPALAARSLAGRKSYMIGLFVDDASGDYVSKVLRGLLNACEENDNHLVVEIIRETGDKEKIQRTLASVRFDGVVLLPPLCDDPVMLEALKGSGIPTARVGPGFSEEGIATVSIDDEGAAYHMTKYLLDQGHSQIGFIKGDPKHACSDQREEGFRRAMADHGLTINEAFVQQGFFSFDSGRLATETLMQLRDRPTAIFASNDEMAAGALEAVQKFDLKVPDNVSVVGFDDDILASVTVPALTTIRQPVEEMAKAAYALVTSDDSRQQDPVFPFEIRERASVQTV